MSNPQTSKISAFQKELLNHGKDIRIGITKYGLSAYISFLPANAARRFSAEEVDELLQIEKIIFGINRDLIGQLIVQVNQECGKVENVLIAQGKPPDQGKDARIEYKFKTMRMTELKEDEHGRVDHKDLRLINNVKKGDLVAVKIPGIPGSAGCNIYGETVSPRQIKSKEIVIGNGLVLSDDRMNAHADMDGHVFLDGNRIILSAVVVVPHDVDLKVGNIDTNGSILVFGNVLSGFTLNAKKNIEVRGVVEGATLLAGGDILCHKGIKGGDRGLIQTDGNLTAEFAETAFINVGGNLQIISSLINCHVQCAGKTHIRGSRGSIVGGEIQSTKGITVYDLGSKMGATTRIIIGDKPILREKIKEAQELLLRAANELKVSTAAIQKLQPILKMLQKLPPSKRRKLENLIRSHQGRVENARELQNEGRRLESIYNLPCAARLEVKHHAFMNVFLTIGHSEKTTKQVEKRVFFRENQYENRIETLPIESGKKQ